MVPAPDAPERIGPYRIVGLLGRGGMGSVHAAVDERTGTTVALKIVDADLARDPRFLSRFRREGQLAAAVRDPHVVPLLGSGVAPGACWLAFELVSGGTLATRLKTGGALPWAEACQLGAQVASGLAAIHAAGLVHRDMKPANVLLTAGGVARIADLGLARRQADGADALTRTGELLGTFEYMAPEQGDDARLVDGRADVYALGAILCTLLTGEPPFKGTGLDLLKTHLFDAPPSLRTRVATIPVAVDELVLRLLSKEPQARGRAADIARELRELAGGKTAPAIRGRLRLALIGSAVSGLALASVVGVVVLGARDAPTTTAPVSSSGTTTAPRPSRSRSPERASRPTSRDPGRPATLPKGLKSGENPGEYLNEVDGSVLVYVPEASFTMGVPLPEPTADPRNSPAHEVRLKAYFIGKYEVSVEQFARFVKAKSWTTDSETASSGRRITYHPGGSMTSDVRMIPGATWRAPWGPGESAAEPSQPVTQVSWTDAAEYCKWAGLDLPTEAQWECAARWDPKSGRTRRWPWGDVDGPPPGKPVANVADTTFLAQTQFFASLHWDEPAVFWPGYRDGAALAAPVDWYREGESPLGVRNLIGNAAEWCRDDYDEAAYKKLPAVASDPLGQVEISYQHSVRGGAFDTGPIFTSTSWRDFQPTGWALADLGFRVVREVR